MGVQKKKSSKKSTRERVAAWKAKGRKMAERALNLAKSVLKKTSNFVFDPKNKNLKEKEKLEKTAEQTKQTEQTEQTEQTKKEE